MFAQIAVNVPTLSDVFDYNVPPEFIGVIGAGYLVSIPFGKQTVQGVILRLADKASVAKTKPILDVVDSQPVLTPVQIALAEWMAQETLSPLAAIIKLMLPAGLSSQADVLYSIRSNAIDGDDSKGEIQKRLLNMLQERGPLRGRQIDTRFRNVNWRKSAEWLVRRGQISKKSVLPSPRVRSKYIRVAQLAVPLTEAREALEKLGKTKATQERRSAALRYLMREPNEINVSWIYAESGCNQSDLQKLAERGLILLRENEIWRDPLERIKSKEPVKHRIPNLTSEQEQAWKKIQSAFSHSSQRPFLLHGVTGSGKTELYIRAAEEAVRRGKQAIILVPEIALTPQTVRRFLMRFPGQVGLIHSKLSEGERYDTWRRARSGSLNVIIGPRSALFVPLPEIGFIALDECHDGSYYQSEPPFYSAVTAAIKYARMTNAICVLGSATPNTVQRWQAENHDSTLLELPTRITSGEDTKDHQVLNLPPVKVVDMREELKTGNRAIFSRSLLKALDETLQRGEQAILFLNRRGTATYVFCRDCGYALKCPKCETPLTYHIHEKEKLTCHHCGYTRQKPNKCPGCDSTQIREYGLGSERVEMEVEKLFPQARVLRWDWETTRKKDAHEIILSHFVSKRADVLVGTQMLAKGLDLPSVTLVGIVLADVGINLPDPFAAERAFQILTQVAGRAGRSALGGQVILQTFQPKHPIIRAASEHNFERFYQQELDGRRMLGYPPYNRLVRLEYRHRENNQAESVVNLTARKLKTQIEAGEYSQTSLIGPTPCFFHKLRGLYRWQIVIRGPNPSDILKRQRLKDWRVEVDPISLL